jgi:hypothetical protein
MIAYSACDGKYFDLYFKYWAHCFNRFYPDMRKIVAVVSPRDDQLEYAKSHGIEIVSVTLPPKSPDTSDKNYIGLYHLLRWWQLPWQHGEAILETQINCLPVRTQHFDNITVEHLRLARVKRGTQLGGLSCAVFTADGAKKVSDEAAIRTKNPEWGDHPINVWMGKALTKTQLLAEQQIKSHSFVLEESTYWITSRTSTFTPQEEKIKLLETGLISAGLNPKEIK